MKIRKVVFILLSVVMGSTFIGCNHKAVDTQNVDPQKEKIKAVDTQDVDQQKEEAKTINTQNVDQQIEVIKAERLSTILPKEWVLLGKGKVEDGEAIVYNRNLDIINITLNKESKYDENLDDLRKECKAEENPNLEVTEMQQYSIGEGFTIIYSGSMAEELIKHRMEELGNYTEQEMEQFKSNIGKMQYVVSTWISVRQERVGIIAIGLNCDKEELIKTAQDIAENVQVEEENIDTNDK